VSESSSSSSSFPSLLSSSSDEEDPVVEWEGPLRASGDVGAGFGDSPEMEE
jgi:hypothetical protein